MTAIFAVGCALLLVGVVYLMIDNARLSRENESLRRRVRGPEFNRERGS